jgi:hypothetical protein
MRNFYGPLLAVAALTAAAVFAHDAQNESAAAKTQIAHGGEAIAGVWRGQMDNLPAVTLNVTYETGSLNGAILFYLHLREPGKTETASAGVPEPLIKPQFDGARLTFSVSHRRAHPPASLDSAPVAFSFTLTGQNAGKLVNQSEDSPELAMVRDGN